MDSVIFDIETGPQPLEKLQSFMPPFDPASLGKRPETFDPHTVKLGNLKDKALIEEKIAKAREAHEKSIAEFDDKLANGEKNYWSDILARAALDALTGRVIAIGYSGKKVQIDAVSESKTEEMIIANFWKTYEGLAKSGRKIVGFNIEEFDIPFLVQRSYILGIAVPRSLFSQGKYLDSTFIDLRKLWKAGRYQATGTLDSICRACGIGGKPDGIDGSMFAELYFDPARRDEALKYLLNDLDMPRKLAERMGIN